MKFIKFIIQIIKSILSSSLLIILIAMLLISFRDYITNSDVKIIIEIISIILFGIYFIYEAYRDIERHQYTTYKYIIVTDMVVLFAFAMMCYLSYKQYDEIDDLIMRGARIRLASLIITITFLLKDCLRDRKNLIK